MPITDPSLQVAQASGHPDRLDQFSSSSGVGKHPSPCYLTAQKREGATLTKEKQVVLVKEGQ